MQFLLQIFDSPGCSCIIAIAQAHLRHGQQSLDLLCCDVLQQTIWHSSLIAMNSVGRLVAGELDIADGAGQLIKAIIKSKDVRLETKI